MCCIGLRRILGFPFLDDTFRLAPQTILSAHRATRRLFVEIWVSVTVQGDLGFQ